MFTKKISHPLFKSLQRGLFSYSGLVDLAGHRDVVIRIKGRSNKNLEFALAELDYLSRDLLSITAPATQEFFDAFEAVKAAAESGEFSLEDEGGELPEIKSPEEVWTYLTLESVAFERRSEYPVRLGFRAPWEVEHDLGIYLRDRKFQYAGVSV